MRVTKTPPAPVNETKIAAWVSCLYVKWRGLRLICRFDANEMINVVELVFVTLHCTNNLIRQTPDVSLSASTNHGKNRG